MSKSDERMTKARARAFREEAVKIAEFLESRGRFKSLAEKLITVHNLLKIEQVLVQFEDETASPAPAPETKPATSKAKETKTKDE